jgi:hypothetical protein
MEAKDKDGVKLRNDAKSTLRAVPTSEFLTYLLLSCVLVGVWAQAAMGAAGAVTWEKAAALSVGVGFGPVLLASITSRLFGGQRPNPPGKMSAAGNLFHLAIGTAFCSVPVAWACWLALAKPDSAGARSWVA